MKSFVATLVLTLSLGLALAAPSESNIKNKEDQAFQECNATNPVQRNPRIAVGLGIVGGEKINITQEEKCFLFCFLQKVKFLNENADIYNGPGLINYTIHLFPPLGKYADLYIVNLWQTHRLIKGKEDKCHKAFVAYHHISEAVFTIAVADGLNSYTQVKEKMVKAIETRQSIDQDLTKQVKQFLDYFDALLTTLAEQGENPTQTQSQEKITIL